MRQVLVSLLLASFACTLGSDRGESLPGDPCFETQECIPGSICFNQFCVGTGSLRVTLSFEVDTDLDLHVMTPFGNEIYFANDFADGGLLDVDQCISSCGQATHVENIVFAGTAPAGLYTVWVENFDGRDGGAFTVEVDVSGGDLLVFEGALPAIEDAASSPFDFAL